LARAIVNKAKSLLSKIRIVDYLILLNMPALFGKFAHVNSKIPDPTNMSGLSYAEARVRLQAEGMNELLATRSRNIPAIALEAVREPMFLLLLGAGGALTFLLLILHVPFLREIFHFAPLTRYQLALSFAAGLCSVLWFELLKLIRRH
jgi:hypothetical protein